MGDIADIYDGTHQTPNYQEQGIKFLSVENIKTLDSDKYISKEDFKNDFKIHPEYGDVLMTRIGSVGVTNFIKTNELLAYYVSLALIKPYYSNGLFLKFLVESLSVQKEIWSKTLHIAFPKKINKNEIGKISISFPILGEQKEIASLLESIDNMITLHQRKINTLETLKKVYLSVMFVNKNDNTPLLRFKNFTGAWEECKLGNLAKFYSGGTPVITKREYYDGNIPFIRSAEISSEKTKLSISDLGLQNSSAKMVSKGDILYALYGATSGEVSISRINGAINQAVLAINLKDSNSTFFIFNWLQYSKEIIITKYLQGGQGNLSSSIIKNLNLKLPNDMKEQGSVGEFLQSFKNTIELHQSMLNKFIKIKQIYLNKMFI